MSWPTVHADPWPNCLYDAERLCGEWGERSIERGWTSLCRCPSCPIKVAVIEGARAARESGRIQA